MWDLHSSPTFDPWPELEACLHCGVEAPGTIGQEVVQHVPKIEVQALDRVIEVPQAQTAAEEKAQAAADKKAQAEAVAGASAPAAKRQKLSKAPMPTPIAQPRPQQERGDCSTGAWPEQLDDSDLDSD